MIKRTNNPEKDCNLCIVNECDECDYDKCLFEREQLNEIPKDKKICTSPLVCGTIEYEME